ncbi:MAG: GNAT family N-acetyltransferase [Ruminococcus sp.]|nr:GNAT family N-acetyltransferase [Ruminococcus sp.]
MSKRSELEKQGYKTYENDEIEVFWNPTVCQHAAKCVQGNGDVFNTQRRPWIDVSKASAKEIAAVIDQCPSGALQYEIKNPVVIEFQESCCRSAALKDGKVIGKCEYRPSGPSWMITHTIVNPEFGGQGIAKRLVEKIIEEARAGKIRIIPFCPYARKMMAGKEEYKDVLE